jgi:hexosaminidase
MYRRLAIEDVRLEQLGLGDESHTDRFLRRIMNGPAIAPLAELLRFAEPVTLGQRVRGAPTVQMTPLVQVVDAARPDPPARWKVHQLVSGVVASSTTGVASRDSLARLFASWRDLAPRVHDAAAASPLAQGAIPAADALASVGRIGLAALEARKSGMPLPRTWTDSAIATLQAADKPQGMLHLVVVPSVRRLLIQ